MNDTLSKSKNTRIVPKELLTPFILITSLFALWGFANAITDPMVQAFKKVLELSNSQAAWVQMAFYGGYFSMALPAALFVRKYSYKVGVLIGLALYALGALLFYPAALMEKFWFFCLGLYVLTFGLAFLETTANPYILSMGSPKTATQRLNLAQAFNPIGLLLGLLVAQEFVLKKLQSDDIADFSLLSEAQKTAIRISDLMVIRDPYVILGLAVLGVFILIAVNKMPQGRADDGEIYGLQNIIQDLFKNGKYVGGVIAQVFYVGAQIMCWTYIYQYAEFLGISSVAAANYQFVAFFLFLIGRAIGTYALKHVSAERLLLFESVIAAILLSMTIGSQGVLGLYALVGVSFCMAVMFPTIYGIALSNLNEEKTKIGAAGLVMAIVGGALLPQLQALIIDIGGSGVSDIRIWNVPEVNLSFILPLLSFVIIAFYGSWVAKEHKKLRSV